MKTKNRCQHNTILQTSMVCHNSCYLHMKILNRATPNGIFIVKSCNLLNRERIEHVLWSKGLFYISNTCQQFPNIVEQEILLHEMPMSKKRNENQLNYLEKRSNPIWYVKYASLFKVMVPAKCFSIDDRIPPHVNKYHLKTTEVCQQESIMQILPSFQKLQAKSLTTNL